ncbi:zonular occludens toxin domain-containing protein, partial [Acinetobacter baumannii]|uniref:zonular occludens toxin domain-containing protein n=1 Tax=Acinetobacter baumannii TaxID=470 RepID=UPI000A977F79
MIYLITATPGSGKTLWAVKEIFARANEAEPWNIFSNIEGLKLDTAQPLKSSFEDYPARSLVVIDEAQKISHFSKKYKHPVKNENHPEVEFLQTHRHAEFLDIIFITQAPRLLNADVLDMVGMHYHLHRPMGMKMATWWLWKYHQLNPNTKSVKADAEDTGTFTYPKHLFGMYTSSKGGGDTHGKIKLPAKLVQGIWMLCLTLIAAGYFYVKQQDSKTEEPKTIKS